MTLEPSPRSLRGLPTLLVTGVDEVATAGATMALAWDLPDAVVVRHHIDVETQQLHRTVSDLTGVLEREVIDLEHLCVSCAIREDVLPTLRRLAGLGRWGAIVAHLPLSASADHLCRVLHLERETDVRIAAVVAALDGESLVDSLTGDVLLGEVGLHTSPEDHRGLAETTGALVAYADVLMVGDAADPDGVELLRALVRPGAQLLVDGAVPDARGLLLGVHDDTRSRAWTAETRTLPCPELDARAAAAVWRLDLRSARPFHPERLHERLEEIGAGAHRSRGCFWLPTRRGQICAWDGAGGQVSIGTLGPWGRSGAHTRLVVTGLRSLTSEAQIAAIRAAFEACLLTDAEMAAPPHHWSCVQDGFEPWLGDVRSSAA